MNTKFMGLGETIWSGNGACSIDEHMSVTRIESY